MAQKVYVATQNRLYDYAVTIEEQYYTGILHIARYGRYVHF